MTVKIDFITKVCASFFIMGEIENKAMSEVRFNDVTV